MRRGHKSQQQNSILLAAAILIQIPNCISNYLYSHKENLLVWLHIGFGFANGLLFWFFGSQFGPMGAAASYLATVALVLLPGEIMFCLNRHERIGALMPWHCCPQHTWNSEVIPPLLCKGFALFK